MRIPGAPNRTAGLAWRFLGLTTVALGYVTLVAGCESSPRWRVAPSTTPSDLAPNITIISPVDGATGVPTATEIVYSTTAATSTTVVLTQSGGGEVPGAAFPSGWARSDGSSPPGEASQPGGSSWLPAEQLRYATRYTARINATVAGKSQVETVSFTTMAKPSGLQRVSSVIGDNQVVGVGMPIILTFNGGDVAEERRAEAERRLFVTSDPPQDGVWNWFNGHEIHFRPRQYWLSGTKLSVQTRLAGLPLGNGHYAANDLTVNAAVGEKIVLKIDDATKQMTVTQDNKIVKIIPVSLGKPSSPSSSGNMIVMSKNREEWFDSSTYGVPADSKDGYRTKVAFTQRLTWDGQYIHAAPWSEADQGVRNVSHGCTNVSAANAEWLFGLTHVGDPVIVTGTETDLTWGNGYTDWNVSFEEYAKGSAIIAPRTQSPAGPVPSGLGDLRKSGSALVGADEAGSLTRRAW